VGRIVGILVVVWLVIGLVAAFQRDYFSDKRETDCAGVGTIAVTVLAGPLNYVGANPKVKCDLPEPSR
jgi:riboflavin transporter FmnP